MRSIPASMTWAILRRGRWYIPGSMLGAVAFPALILIPLLGSGTLPVQDRSMLVLNFVIMQMFALNFGAVMYEAQGKVAHLYSFPIRSSAIVVFRLVPAMLIIALQMLICTALLNLMFGLSWPIWGAALLAATAFACIEAAIRLTEKSTPWLIVAVSIVGGTLGLWFKSHFGGVFSEPQHFWDALTPLDAVTMLGFAVAAYCVAVYAVARNRRGEAPVSVGILDWFEQRFARSANLPNSFDGPLRAIAWAEWKRKGWAMPFAILMLLAIGLVVWIFSDRTAENLIAGAVVGGFTLAILGFIGGVIFGNTGSNDGDYVMGSFLGTRPISDSELARATLTAAAKSMLLAWLIWVAAVGVAYAAALACGAGSEVHLPRDLGWWCFPATLAAAWILLGVIMSLGLTGRAVQTILPLCMITALVIAGAISSNFLLSPSSRLLLQRATVIAAACSILAFGLWAFSAARRRAFISDPAIWAAATIWLVGTSLVAFALPEFNQPRGLVVLLAAAGAALAVIPIAAAPLAISVNRHR